MENQPDPFFAASAGQALVGQAVTMCILMAN
jgi:hypothetical protein